MQTVNGDANERLGKIETEVEGFHNELSEIRSSLRAISEKMEARNKTDWQTIFMGLMVIGALYAAAIRPIENEQARYGVTAATLAEAVRTQNEVINNMRVSDRDIESRIVRAERDIDQMARVGTAESNLRLSLIEQKLAIPQPK